MELAGEEARRKLASERPARRHRPPTRDKGRAPGYRGQQQTATAIPHEDRGKWKSRIGKGTTRGATGAPAIKSTADGRVCAKKKKAN